MKNIEYTADDITTDVKYNGIMEQPDIKEYSSGFIQGYKDGYISATEELKEKLKRDPVESSYDFWKFGNKTLICPACGYVSCEDDDGILPAFAFNYCPICGKRLLVNIEEVRDDKPMR